MGPTVIAQEMVSLPFAMITIGKLDLWNSLNTKRIQDVHLQKEMEMCYESVVSTF